jgi:hypothetical protein
MASDCAGKSMLTLKQAAVEQSCAANAAAESDHHGVPRTARGAESMFAKQSKPRVVLKEEGYSESSLEPGAQVKLRCVVELMVGRENALFPRVHNAAKTEHNRRTISAVEMSNAEQLNETFADRRQ